MIFVFISGGIRHEFEKIHYSATRSQSMGCNPTFDLLGKPEGVCVIRYRTSIEVTLRTQRAGALSPGMISARGPVFGSRECASSWSTR